MSEENPVEEYHVAPGMTYLLTYQQKQDFLAQQQRHLQVAALESEQFTEMQYAMLRLSEAHGVSREQNHIYDTFLCWRGLTFIMPQPITLEGEEALKYMEEKGVDVKPFMASGRDWRTRTYRWWEFLKVAHPREPYPGIFAYLDEKADCWFYDPERIAARTAASIAAYKATGLSTDQYVEILNSFLALGNTHSIPLPSNIPFQAIQCWDAIRSHRCDEPVKINDMTLAIMGEYGLDSKILKESQPYWWCHEFTCVDFVRGCMKKEAYPGVFALLDRLEQKWQREAEKSCLSKCFACFSST
eukprot:TRINITY_DN42324_c0_g1_i3.p1 TRINITY_DN42324_c0_g1~~TRINITY_DN42324_c0_g1_i3.p1  ORF type:complete len:300 (-),score=30.89 TRINITY_DN42324_c0_g1_i3:75-974(-)